MTSQADSNLSPGAGPPRAGGCPPDPALVTAAVRRVLARARQLLRPVPKSTAAQRHAFPACILVPLLDDVLGQRHCLPAACIDEPDDTARGRLAAELADAAAARGVTVISAGGGCAGLSRYAMPGQAAYREFTATAADPGRENPVLLIAPPDLPAAILRDITKRKAAWVVMTCPGPGGDRTGSVPPDEYSLLWHDGELTAANAGIATLLDVALHHPAARAGRWTRWKVST